MAKFGQILSAAADKPETPRVSVAPSPPKGSLAAMQPVPLYYVDAKHVLMSNGWVARGELLLPFISVFTPLFLLPRMPTKSMAASKIIASTPPPKQCSKRRRPAAPSKFKIGIRCAQQRWSAFVTAPTSRLAQYMKVIVHTHMHEMTAHHIGERSE